MPGSAKTSQFHFSAATLMVGPMTEQLGLETAEHSLGLVKNVTVEATPGSVELTQGIMNDVVMTMINSMDIKVSAEVYEFTARNLAYGLSLDGSSAGYDAIASAYALSASAAAAATSAKVATDKTSEFTAGKWVFLQEGTDDVVHLAKIASSSYSSPDTTVTFTGFPIPAGQTYTTGGRMGLITKIDFDPNAALKYVSVRIVGTLAGDKRPVAIHFPKTRITKGFAMRFATDAFANLPFEFTPYAPIASDSGYNSNFNQRMHVFMP